MGEINLHIKPRILLVIEGTYPWYRGGVSEWVHQYLQNSTEYEFVIIQVVTETYLNVPVNEAHYKVPEHVCDFIRILPPNLQTKDKSELLQWFENIKKAIQPAFRKCDIIHLVNTGYAGWLGMMIACRLNKPLVLTEHALYWKEVQMGAAALECGYKMPAQSPDQARYAMFFRKIAREIYSAASRVISVSECNIPAQKRLGAREVCYIPNGVNESRIKRSSRIQKSRLTIGWVGRCASMKDPLKFFELADAFSGKMPDAKFIMVSCDANEPELAQLVRQKSDCYPNLRLVWNEDAESYYDQMNALCITSRNESQPLVMLEALARKVLPIGWQAGDVRAKYGCIFPRKTSVDEFTEAINQLWSRPEVWQYEVQKRFDQIAKEHSWGNIFKRYKQLFKNLLEAKVYASQPKANDTI